jgi:hypothetical protein
VKGHALTLSLIGSYLRDAYDGNILQRDRIKLEEADTEEQGGHAFRAMDAYVGWFESDGEKGQRALAMLRLTGLFDRPVDAGCLAALWRAPPIGGLTEPLFAVEKKFFGLKREYRPIETSELNIILKRLADAKLVTVNRDAGSALVSLDAHPLLREYFAKVLRETSLEAWKEAHRRLYEHLTTTTPDKEAPTLDDLQPLYQAVAHGCHAEMQVEAREKVYRDRILRGTGPGGFYSTYRLGAYGADLGAVACFFDRPWQQVSANLPLPSQSWLLNQAAFCLRGLGRLAEAQEPMRASLDMYVAQDNWRQAGILADKLVEMELTLGDVGAAIRYGERAVAYAEKSGDADRRVVNRAGPADALHQAGRRGEAEARFLEAEAMQAQMQPQLPSLYSLQGFRYCDLLLTEAERVAWRRLLAHSAFAPPAERVAAGPPSQASIASLLSLRRIGDLRLSDRGLPQRLRACKTDPRMGDASKLASGHRPRPPHPGPRRALQIDPRRRTACRRAG